MRAWGNQEVMRSSDRVITSAIAGTTTGAVSGLLRELHSDRDGHNRPY